MGLGWFAELGQALSAGDLGTRHAPEKPVREFILGKATGVVLLRGSVVVTC